MKRLALTAVHAPLILRSNFFWLLGIACVARHYACRTESSARDYNCDWSDHKFQSQKKLHFLAER